MEKDKVFKVGDEVEVTVGGDGYYWCNDRCTILELDLDRVDGGGVMVDFSDHGNPRVYGDGRWWVYLNDLQHVKPDIAKMLTRKQTDREIFELLLAGETLIQVDHEKFGGSVPSEIKMVGDYVIITECQNPSRKGSLMLLPDLNPYEWEVKSNVKELTHAEIEEILGYPVKIV